MGVSMGNFLCRPAIVTAKKSLLWGLFWMLVGAILGWYFSVVPTSIVDYTWGRNALISYVIYGLLIWVSLAVPTLLVVLLLRRRVVVWELFGRMLYAHIPVTFIMLPAMFGDKVSFSIFMSSPFSSQLSLPYVVLMLLYVVVLVAWFFYWSYVVFRHVTQLKGFVCVVLFVVALTISYWMSEYAIGGLMTVGDI